MPRARKRLKRKDEWKDMQRCYALEHFIMGYLQDQMNIEYLNGSRAKSKAIKFETNLDNPQKVLCLIDGLYYRSTVSHYRMCTPATLNTLYSQYLNRADVPVEERVLSYMLWRVDWPRKKEHDGEVPENELISCEVDDPVAVLGMLTAHNWNCWKQSELGYTRKDMGPGVFFLDDDVYIALERAWQHDSNETASFDEFYRQLYASSLPSSPAISGTSISSKSEEISESVSEVGDTTIKTLST